MNRHLVLLCFSLFPGLLSTGFSGAGFLQNPLFVTLIVGVYVVFLPFCVLSSSLAVHCFALEP